MPDVRPDLVQALLNEWPSYVAYAVSFFTIVIIWINHHAILDVIAEIDRTLGFLNGFLLVTVAVVPFPTSLVAHYLEAGHDENTAAVVYGLTMSLMAFAFSLISLNAHNRRLITTRFSILGFTMGQFAYPAGTLIALVSARAAVLVFAATTAFYIAWPLVREAQARDRSGGRGP